MMQFIRVSIAVLAAGALACGGGESDSASLVAPMKADAETSSSPNRSPVIRSVHLEPAAPVSGDRVNQSGLKVDHTDTQVLQIGHIDFVAPIHLNSCEFFVTSDSARSSRDTWLQSSPP